MLDVRRRVAGARMTAGSFCPGTAGDFQPQLLSTGGGRDEPTPTYEGAVALFGWLRIHDMDDGRRLLGAYYAHEPELYQMHLDWLRLYLGLG